MAYASTGVKGEGSGDDSGGAGFSFAVNGTTAGNLLVLGVILNRTTTTPAPIITMTGAGNTFTWDSYSWTSPQSALVAYSVLATGGNLTITIKGNGSNSWQVYGAAEEFSGNPASSPASGAASGATGTSAAMDGGSYTPSDADALYVSMGGPASSGAVTENQSPGDTDWTLSNENESGGSYMGSMVTYIRSGAAVARRAVWSNTSSVWAVRNQAFKPSGGGRGPMFRGS